jgi:hypothetical protein
MNCSDRGCLETQESEVRRTRRQVKVCLTSGQVMRLLCVRGRSNLFTVRSIQSTENAHDKRNPPHPDRAGAPCRHSDGCFGSCCPVCDVGRLARDDGPICLDLAAPSSGSGTIPIAGEGPAKIRYRCGRDRCKAAPARALCGDRTRFAGRLPDSAPVVALSAAEKHGGVPDSGDSLSSLRGGRAHDGEKRALRAQLRQNRAARLRRFEHRVPIRRVKRWMPRPCARCRRH